MSLSHRFVAHRIPARLTAALAVLPILATFVLLPRLASAQEVPQLQITSKYYIVIDADTGEVFAQRGAHQKVAIASLTKVYTAIEAIELAPSDMPMVTDQSDVFNDQSTRMGFGAGEHFTFQDLLYGMLLPSGNDAAHAIARNLGKELQPQDNDQQAVNYFVNLTNERIRNLGLTETHLVNPHGWGVPGHYSSAHDLATFMLYAMKYPRFMEAISTASYTTSDGNYSFNNSNRMLNLYDGIVGGKTGFDDDAGYCLIEVARRDGNTMISVTLNGVAPDDWYDDDAVLLDYAFAQKAKRVAAGQPITGEVLSYRDPDAAVIAQDARSGGSLAGAAHPVANSAGGAHAAGSGKAAPANPPSSGSVERGQTSDTADRLGVGLHFLAVLAVAMVVIAAGAFSALRRGSRRDVTDSLRRASGTDRSRSP